MVAQSVLHGAEAFVTLGKVRVIPDREIEPRHLKNADALITRSKTTLGRELLEGSGVRFVGTCTAGTDHADIDWMRSADIYFADAGGCNANAVSEYLVMALLEFDQRFALLQGEPRTLGIVGHGHVGKRVEVKAQALGMNVLLNDPPKAERLANSTAEKYVDLETVLRESDALTFHTPLVEDGPHPTRGLLNRDNARHLRDKVLLVNTCRGEVIDNEVLREGNIRAMILDVWDPEPVFPEEVFARALLGTPHIAGHSFEGKFDGTWMIYNQACEFFGAEATWDVSAYRNPDLEPIQLAPGMSPLEGLRTAVRAACDFRIDHAMMTEALYMEQAETSSGVSRGRDAFATADRGELFTYWRNHYRDRREFQAHRVQVDAGDSELAELLNGLGFQVEVI